MLMLQFILRSRTIFLNKTLLNITRTQLREVILKHEDVNKLILFSLVLNFLK